MATTSANESKVSKYQEFKNNQGIRYDKGKESHHRNHGYKTRENNFMTNSNDNSSRNHSIQAKDHINKKGQDNCRFQSKNNTKSLYVDKDDDIEHKGKHHKSTDSRSKNSNGKEKEQQIDKLETMKRLEREKKAMQKKIRDEEVEKQKRSPMKQKRSTRIDWTKGYEYGLIDEDVDYAEFY